MWIGQYRPPYLKAWAAVYADEKSEFFEIRTIDRQGITPYYPLWHAEFPLGTALVDFLYVDFSTWGGYLELVRTSVESLNKGQNAAENFERIWEFSRFCLKQSPIFVSLVADMEHLRVTYDRGEKLSTEELERHVAYYKDLQPKLLQLAHNLFETDDPTDLDQRYTDLWREDCETYPQLSYGRVDVQEVWRGGFNFINYDDYADFAGRDDSEEPPQELFTTAVVSGDEPEDLVNFLLHRYMQEHLQLKLCKFCGKYFGTKRSYKTEYCDRLIPGSTKTCRQAGSVRLYEKRKFEIPAIKEYKRSYKAHNARIRYGIMTKEEFAAWSKEAREKRDLCIAGKLSLEDFVAWLDSDKM